MIDYGTDYTCPHGYPPGECTDTQCWLAEAPPGEETTARRSWRRVDLSTVLDGTYTPPRATVGARSDGVGMLYAGRVHTLAGESEAGKSWLALHIALTELERGNGVVYLDFEDDEGGVVGRLLAMGARPDHIRDRFGYIRPEEPVRAAINRADLAEALADLRPTVATLDGVTEAMALHGMEYTDNTDVALFGQLLPRAIAEQGPAVLLLDHVPKDRENRGRYAIGGVHKLNGVNGAAFTIENRQPFGVGLTGKSTVYIAKDRPGYLRGHGKPAKDGLSWFADMTIDSHDAGFVEMSVVLPDGDPGPFRPTVLMRKVSEALKGAPGPLSKQGIEERVTGRALDIRRATAALVDDGYVVTEMGPRGAVLHRLVKPYGEES